MTEVLYYITEDRFSEKSDARISYGIGIMDKNEGKCIRVIRDISCKRDKVAAIVALCNRLELSVLHIDDVIEDFLSDLEILY